MPLTPASEPGSHAMGRLRFDHLEMVSFADSHCEAHVTLTGPSGTVIETRVRGADTQEGRLRASAEATLEAASSAAGGQVEFELAGSKAVRAFDAAVVIVAIRATVGSERYRLTGCYSSEPEHAARSAALAALDAINRVLAPLLE